MTARAQILSSLGEPSANGAVRAGGGFRAVSPEGRAGARGALALRSRRAEGVRVFVAERFLPNGAWACAACTYNANAADSPACEICAVPRGPRAARAGSP